MLRALKVALGLTFAFGPLASAQVPSCFDLKGSASSLAGLLRLQDGHWRLRLESKQLCELDLFGVASPKSTAESEQLDAAMPNDIVRCSMKIEPRDISYLTLGAWQCLLTSKEEAEKDVAADLLETGALSVDDSYRQFVEGITEPVKKIELSDLLLRYEDLERSARLTRITAFDKDLKTLASRINMSIAQINDQRYRLATLDEKFGTLVADLRAKITAIQDRLDLEKQFAVEPKSANDDTNGSKIGWIEKKASESAVGAASGAAAGAAAGAAITSAGAGWYLARRKRRLKSSLTKVVGLSFFVDGGRNVLRKKDDITLNALTTVTAEFKPIAQFKNDLVKLRVEIERVNHLLVVTPDVGEFKTKMVEARNHMENMSSAGNSMICDDKFDQKTFVSGRDIILDRLNDLKTLDKQI